MSPRNLVSGYIVCFIAVSVADVNLNVNFSDSDREEIKIFERKTCICGTTGRGSKTEEGRKDEAVFRYKGTNREDQWRDFWILPSRQYSNRFFNSG